MDCVDLDLCGEPQTLSLPAAANDDDDGDCAVRLGRLLRVIQGAVTPAE